MLISPFPLNSATLSPRVQGTSLPILSVGNSLAFKSGVGLVVGPSSMFTVKGFVAQVFAAILKWPYGPAKSLPSSEIVTDDEIEVSETQRSGSRCQNSAR